MDSSLNDNSNTAMVEPHTLVKILPMHVKMVPAENAHAELSDAGGEAGNIPIPPFVLPLPIPPNSSLFNSSLAKKLNTPIPNAPQILVRTPPFSQMKSKSNKMSLFEDFDISKEITNKVLNRDSDGIDRSDWKKRAIEKNPFVNELHERIYPLRRALAFGTLYDAGKNEVKEILNDEAVTQFILQHLNFEGLRKSRKSLEEETGITYKTIDVEGSLIHGLFKEAIKSTENLYDAVIADKFTVAEKQKKKLLQNKVDEALAELGFEEEDEDIDVNIWNETGDRQNVNIIVETDPITRVQQFQAGTLNKLVERLTSISGDPDLQYMKSFLMTYPSFTTHDKLLEKLIQRFNVPNKSNAPEDNNKKLAIQNRVCNVLRSWLENYHSYFNKSFMNRLTDFVKNHIEPDPNLNKCAVQIKSFMEQNTAANTNALSNDYPPPKVPLETIFTSKLDIGDVDEEEVARQLTLIEFGIFSKIQPAELLNQAWSRPKLRYRAQNLIHMIERFNDISTWTASLIITPQKIKDRANNMKRAIRIATMLRKLNNFNTLQAVLAGINHGAVQRLKYTREDVPRIFQENLAELNALMSAQNNYKAYRAALKQAVDPCIPFLGMYLTDLTFIDENPDNIQTPNGQLINWAKREMLSEIIYEIQSHQNTSYHFIPVHQIQTLLLQLKDKKPDELLPRESLQREPKYASRETIQ